MHPIDRRLNEVREEDGKQQRQEHPARQVDDGERAEEEDRRQQHAKRANVQEGHGELPCKCDTPVARGPRVRHLVSWQSSSRVVADRREAVNR
jgi:hypothetical protein